MKAENIFPSDNDSGRPSWDEYFFEIADSVSKRATCDRGKSGCVIVKNRQILVTGFVGSPAGFSHCDDVGHQIKRLTHERGRWFQNDLRVSKYVRYGSA